MADGVSTQTANTVLNVLLRQQSAVGEPTWLALFGAHPAFGTISEFTAGDYERVSVTFDASFVNDAELVWPMALTPWGVIEFIVVVDTATKGTGNIILWEDGSGSSVIAGNRVKIAAGQYAVSMVTVQ